MKNGISTEKMVYIHTKNGISTEKMVYLTEKLVYLRKLSKKWYI